MANIGGPTHSKPRLLMETNTSDEKRANALLAVHRTSALMITSAYRIVSGITVLFITGTIPADLKIRELMKTWHKKQYSIMEQGEEEQVRRDTLHVRQDRWSAYNKGIWTADSFHI